MAAAATNPPIAPTADHTWRKGLMTTQDLARYKARERDPIKSTYRGLTVYGMGPPSSGGTTVAIVVILGVVFVPVVLTCIVAAASGS